MMHGCLVLCSVLITAEAGTSAHITGNTQHGYTGRQTSMLDVKRRKLKSSTHHDGKGYFAGCGKLSRGNLWKVKCRTYPYHFSAAERLRISADQALTGFHRGKTAFYRLTSTPSYA